MGKTNEGGGKAVAKPRVAALPSLVSMPAEGEAADWSSLLADLSAGISQEPQWRIHDRTHLEFSLEYDLGGRTGTQEFEWDVYFFVPKSLRLDETTYSKKNIYEDLMSYVRLAAPQVPLEKIAGAPAEQLKRVLSTGVDRKTALRELRIFACIVRAAGVRARRAILSLLDGDASEVSTASRAAVEMAAVSQSVTAAFRDALAAIPEERIARDEELAEGVRWVDEDISRVFETLLGSLAIELRKKGAPEREARIVASSAVEQAQYRTEQGLEGVGHARADKSDLEHLEFRRNVLKRFTSSVLWLKLEVRQARTIAKQVLDSLAAMVAMAFAVAAALWAGPDPYAFGNIWLWVIVAVVAYAFKDRIKAFLQTVFSSYLAKRFPDRRWRILDVELRTVLGRVNERAGFVPEKDVPAGALDVRRRSRKHAFEADSRPERVLWHHKTVQLSPAKLAGVDGRFEAVTEIFRLSVSDWLEHTDDPKRTIVFADPDDRKIYTAVAPRVYNISVVYRLRTPDTKKDAPWRRLRIVVTRKGILRIEHVS